MPGKINTDGIYDWHPQTPQGKHQEGKLLFKIKDKADIRTNESQMAMNKYTLQVKFLMIKAGRLLRNFTWEGGIQGVFLQK